LDKKIANTENKKANVVIKTNDRVVMPTP